MEKISKRKEQLKWTINGIDINLDKVPPVGAIIYCFPIKIARASAGWVRAVATIPE